MLVDVLKQVVDIVEILRERGKWLRWSAPSVLRVSGSGADRGIPGGGDLSRSETGVSSSPELGPRSVSPEKRPWEPPKAVSISVPIRPPL